MPTGNLGPLHTESYDRSLADAEATLTQLAGLFLQNRTAEQEAEQSVAGKRSPDLEARYRALLDQIPAIVFMAYLDEGNSEAYVSPQIEHSLGFSPTE